MSRAVVGRVRPGISRALAAIERKVGNAAPPSPPVALPSVEVSPARSMVEAFAGVTLGDLMADQTPVSIHDPLLSWLDLPSTEFMDWVMNREPEVWDAIAPTADFFGSPTFSQVQAHRLWLTVEQLRPWLPGDDGLVVDVGSYPFSVPVALRQFVAYRGRILSTVNQRLDDDVRIPLRRLGIEWAPVNLDPLVAVSTHLEGMTDAIPVAAGAVDLVVLAHVIEHLYHPMMLLREISRVLKPGGALVITTDNAFLLHGLISQLTTAACLHEPVEQTAAMLFDDWRRHVRFFTADDLSQMADAVGLEPVETRFAEVLYSSVPAEVFPHPMLALPAWRARVLTAVPAMRNDVSIVAVKRG